MRAKWRRTDAIRLLTHTGRAQSARKSNHPKAIGSLNRHDTRRNVRLGLEVKGLRCALNRQRTPRKIPRAALIEGQHLEGKLPIKAFITLESLWPKSRNWFDGAFHDWLQAVKSHNRLTVGWIKSLEAYPQLHLHGALVAASPLDCLHAEQSWRNIVYPRYKHAAKVEPYAGDKCGLGYILKRLDSQYEDIQFSCNISAFSPDSDTRFFGQNSYEKRQLRRIRSQFKPEFPKA
jgi:hypothetical protein